jgi:hypothetical protein
MTFEVTTARYRRVSGWRQAYARLEVPTLQGPLIVLAETAHFAVRWRADVRFPRDGEIVRSEFDRLSDDPFYRESSGLESVPASVFRAELLTGIVENHTERGCAVAEE